MRRWTLFVVLSILAVSVGASSGLACAEPRWLSWADQSGTADVVRLNSSISVPTPTPTGLDGIVQQLEAGVWWKIGLSEEEDLALTIRFQGNGTVCGAAHVFLWNDTSCSSLLHCVSTGDGRVNLPAARNLGAENVTVLVARDSSLPETALLNVSLSLASSATTCKLAVEVAESFSGSRFEISRFHSMDYSPFGSSRSSFFASRVGFWLKINRTSLSVDPSEGWLCAFSQNTSVNLRDVSVAVLVSGRATPDCDSAYLLDSHAVLRETGGVGFYTGNDTWVFLLVSVDRSVVQTATAKLELSGGTDVAEDARLCNTAHELSIGSDYAVEDLCTAGGSSAVGAVHAFSGLWPDPLGFCGAWIRLLNSSLPLLLKVEPLSNGSLVGSVRLDAFDGPGCPSSLASVVVSGKGGERAGGRAAIYWPGGAASSLIVVSATPNAISGSSGSLSGGWNVLLNSSTGPVLPGSSVESAFSLSSGWLANCSSEYEGVLGSDAVWYEIPWNNMTFSQCSAELDEWGEGGKWFVLDTSVASCASGGNLTIQTVGAGVKTKVAVFEFSANGLKCLAASSGSGEGRERSFVGLELLSSRILILVMSNGLLSSAGGNGSFSLEVSQGITVGSSPRYPSSLHLNTATNGSDWVGYLNETNVCQLPTSVVTKPVDAFDTVSINGLWFDVQFMAAGRLGTYSVPFNSTFLPAFVVCVMASEEDSSCLVAVLMENNGTSAQVNLGDVVALLPTGSPALKNCTIRLLMAEADPNNTAVATPGGWISFSVLLLPLPLPTGAKCDYGSRDFTWLRSSTPFWKNYTISSTDLVELHAPGLQLDKCPTSALQYRDLRPGRWITAQIGSDSSTKTPIYVAVDSNVPIHLIYFGSANCTMCLDESVSAYNNQPGNVPRASFWGILDAAFDAPDSEYWNFPFLVVPLSPIDDANERIVFEFSIKYEWPAGSMMATAPILPAITGLNSLPIGTHYDFSLSLNDSNVAVRPPCLSGPEYDKLLGWYNRVGGPSMWYDWLSSGVAGATGAAGAAGAAAEVKDETGGNDRKPRFKGKSEFVVGGAFQPARLVFRFNTTELGLHGASVYLIANSSSPRIMARLNSSGSIPSFDFGGWSHLYIDLSMDNVPNLQLPEDWYLFVMAITPGMLHASAFGLRWIPPPPHVTPADDTVEEEPVPWLSPLLVVPVVAVGSLSLPSLSSPGVDAAVTTFLRGLQCSAILLQVGTTLPAVLVKLGGFVSIVNLGFSLPFDIDMGTETDTKLGVYRSSRRRLMSMSQYADRKGMSEGEVFPAQIFWTLLVVCFVETIFLLVALPCISTAFFGVAAVRKRNRVTKVTYSMLRLSFVQVARGLLWPLSFTMLPLAATSTWYFAHSHYASLSPLATFLYIVAVLFFLAGGPCCLVPGLHCFGGLLFFRWPSLVIRILIGSELHATRRWWVVVPPLSKLFVGAVVGLFFDVPALQITLLVLMYGFYVVGILVWHPFISPWRTVHELWIAGSTGFQFFLLYFFLGNKSTTDPGTFRLVVAYFLIWVMIMSLLISIGIVLGRLFFHIHSLAGKSGTRVVARGVAYHARPQKDGDEPFGEIPKSDLAGSAFLKGSLISALGIVDRFRGPRLLPETDTELGSPDELSVDGDEG